MTLPSETVRLNSSPGAFLKSSLTIFTGKTASPGSRTFIPDAVQIIDVLISVACKVTLSSDALTRTEERMLIELELEVLLSASPQLWRNNFLFIESFIWMTSCSYLYNIKNK